jgi:hypothetical protein
MKVNHTSVAIKFALVFLILVSIPWYCSIPTILIMTWGYQYIVALIFNVHVMPTMDMICLIGDDKTQVNFMSLTQIEKLEFDKVKERFRRFVNDKRKLRWTLHEIFGDYYWKEIGIEETVDYSIQRLPKDCKTERDVEEFIEQELNVPMQKNKP